MLNPCKFYRVLNYLFIVLHFYRNIIVTKVGPKTTRDHHTASSKWAAWNDLNVRTLPPVAPEKKRRQKPCYAHHTTERQQQRGTPVRGKDRRVVHVWLLLVNVRHVCCGREKFGQAKRRPSQTHQSRTSFSPLLSIQKHERFCVSSRLSGFPAQYSNGVE